jgi:hypothetical protein|tara:strand:- start:81 stop:656 length:576 start_codon:yes stop_codon:yes gene_type:complete
LKRFNGPLYTLIRKLWDFEDVSPYTLIEPEKKEDEIEVPLCLNCLEPLRDHGWFCSKCGWPSSFYASQMPYIKIFCLGAFFRSGVDGSVNLTKFRITGLLIAALFQYHIFAPFYFYRLYRASKGDYIQDSGLKEGKRFYLAREAYEYPKYSLQELYDEYGSIDRLSTPDRFKSLIDEFKKRKEDPDGVDNG